jgi:YD repeat-containing protein
VFLFSCKKESTSNPAAGNTGVSKIKTWTGGSYITNYTFDAAGRCTREDYNDGSKSTYEYLAGKVILKRYNSSGVNTDTYNYETDANGLATKVTRPNNLTYDETIIYNNDKQAVKRITHISGTTQVIDYFYSNGNSDSARITTNGNWQTTIKRTFFTDKLNSLSNEAQGTGFYGKDNKNLLKTEIYTYADGSTNTPSAYNYEFDAQGRAIKETRTQGGNINIGYITYY